MSHSTFNPLASILKDNKLTGPNYVDWKRNLDIVLTADKITFVLTTPCPPEPAANATAAVKKEHEKWVNGNDMAKCYILASMSNVLQHQHQNFGTAAEIMANLLAMFGEQNRTKRQLAMNSLQQAEDLVKKNPSVMISENVAKPKPKGKGNWKKGKKFIPNGAKGGVNKNSKKGTKAKGDCFHCGKPGHWKRNCRIYLATLKNKEGMQSFITETNLLDFSSTSWCVDSGSTNHVCNMLQGFQETRRLNEGEVYLKLGTEARVAAVSVGVYYLALGDKVLVLENCFYVPKIRRNLISVSYLSMSGYSVQFGSKVVIRLNNKFIASGILENGLYFIPPMLEMNDTVVESSSVLSCKRKTPSFNPTYLWHTNHLPPRLVRSWDVHPGNPGSNLGGIKNRKEGG
ncbi:hypothetical protein ACHQM5_019846 [Ranunculus cassubicifolius]